MLIFVAVELAAPAVAVPVMDIAMVAVAVPMSMPEWSIV
jgi:hypothetical protein